MNRESKIRNFIHRSWDWLRELQHRYNAIHGPSLASGITLYGFLALFALLILAVAVVGLFANNDGQFAANVVKNLGITGEAARTVTKTITSAQSSHQLASVVGVMGIIWLGTSFALVTAHAFDAAWNIPGEGLTTRGRGILWLLGMVALAVVALGATSLWALLPNFLSPIVLLISLGANTGLWMWTSWILPHRKMSWRVTLVPSFAAAVALEILKILGAYVVPRLVSSSSEIYGTLGVVFALLAWLLILGRIVVYLAVIEAWQGQKLEAVNSKKT